MRGLTGRRVIITGGGGGIGRAVATRLLEEGGQAALFDISAEAAEAAADDLEAATGIRPFPVEVDVAVSASVAAGVAAAREAMGGIDGLVSNAGFPARESVVDLDEENFERTMAVDVRGLFLLCRNALPYLLEHEASSIVATSSMQALAAAPGRFAYSASKGAVSAAVRQLAVDYGPVGVRVNAVVPGAILSPANEVRLATAMSPESLERLKTVYPLRRLGRPDDVASAVCFLLSSEASWITGTNMVIDGGATVQLAEAVVSDEYDRYRAATAALAAERRAAR